MGEPALNHNLELNDRLAQVMIHRVQEMFESMFNVSVKAGDIEYLQGPSNLRPISATIQIISDIPEGQMVMTIPKETIAPILEEAFQKQVSQDEKFVRESVGELTNVLFSLFKRSLQAEGLQLKMQIPKVVDNQKDLEVELQKHAKTCSLVIPFKAGHGQFEVSVNLQLDEL